MTEEQQWAEYLTDPDVAMARAMRSDETIALRQSGVSDTEIEQRIKQFLETYYDLMEYNADEIERIEEKLQECEFMK